MHTPAADATDQPASRIYRLRVIALPEVERPDRTLAAMAKRMLRSYGLRLLTCEPERPVGGAR